MIKFPISEEISYYFTAQSYSTNVLYPEELLYTKGYENHRLNEYCTGRYCAHNCLQQIDKSSPILKNEIGAPIWPQGFTGSISHTNKLTGAIVSTKTHFKSIGLDIETIGRVTSDLWPLLFTKNEIQQLNNSTPQQRDYLSTQLYGMKEAFYKMQYQLTGAFLDFHDCEIEVSNNKPLVHPLVPLTLLPKPESITTQFFNYGNQIISLITI